MSNVLWVKVENNVVTQVIDHAQPPANGDWRNAIEVKNALGPNQYYGQQTIDLTTTPVQIVYPIHQFTSAEITQNAAVAAAAQAAEAARVAAQAANGGKPVPPAP